MASHARSEKHGEAMTDVWIGRSEYWPKPANIVQLAAEVEDPGNVAAKVRRDCPHCHGDGFVSRDQPYGLTAGIPCDHTGTFPNHGVKLTPELEARYRRDMLEGDERGEAWAKNPANPVNRPAPVRPAAKELRRVGWDDIDRVKANLR